MKLRTAILAAALVATSGYAFAQSTSSPADQNRPGLAGDDSAKAKDNMGNTGKMGAGNVKGSMAPATTGAGTKPMKDTMEKNASPASTKAGEKTEK